MPSLAELLLAATLGAHADTPGTILPAAPAVPPGIASAWPADRLAEARTRWRQGDAAGTAIILEPWLASSRGGPRGRTRTSAHLLAGMAQLKLENHNLASSHFYRVRRTGGAIAPYGAWYEALVDLRRGRHLVAARECAAYRQNYPDGIHADECLLLEGEAYARAGRRTAAFQRYDEYLEKHPDSPREEEIDVARVRAAAYTDPARAVRMAHALWLTHSYPSTDLAVTSILSDLAEQGVDTTLPDRPRDRISRCETLRRSGQFDAAWAMFQELKAEAPDSPELAAWVSRSEERFAWATRHYSDFAEVQEAEYADSPTAETAWSIYVAHSRAGRWDKAAEWARMAEKKHKGHWRWRDKEPLARAEMLSGNYEAAHDRWSTMSGANAAFMAAFCAYKADMLDKAEALLDPIAARRGAWQAAAHYWRGQIKLSRGDEADAQADLDAAVELDRTGWYLLLQQQPPAQTDDWARRDGRWHGDTPITLPTWSTPSTRPLPAEGMLPSYTPIVRHNGKTIQGLQAPTGHGSTVDWSALRWPQPAPTEPPTPTTTTAIAPGPILAPDTVGALPDGYTSCDWFDPAAAEGSLYNLARRHGGQSEELWAAYDLVQAGQHGEAARLIGPLYEDWKAGGGPSLSSAQWREVFLATQAHHYASRFCAGLGRGATDEASKKAALRLAYPVVRAPELWSHSQRFDLDPFLVMGIMRQESTYQEFVVSHAGAIGLVQVMPRTGARVAALMGEQAYSPGDLEDPSINIRYGAFYLSRLMERFGGNYPLSVASYNGGPHNVSRWMRQIKGTVTLAEYVEHIPWDETRDYVKRVSGHYARYAYLYGPDGAALALPGAPDHDDPTVIDF